MNSSPNGLLKWLGGFDTCYEVFGDLGYLQLPNLFVVGSDIFYLGLHVSR